MDSDGREEGTVGIVLVGRGKMPESGLRDLVRGGREEGRVELVSKLVLMFELRVSLVVGGVGLDVATGRSEERGTSVVCTTP